MKLLRFFKAIGIAIKYKFNTTFYTFHFWRMKRKADKLHEIKGKQYFVIPLDGKTLVVVDGSYIDTYYAIAKKTNLSKLTYVALIEMCYYKTPAGTYTRKNK